MQFRWAEVRKLFSEMKGVARDREGACYPDVWHGLFVADALGSSHKLNVAGFITYTDSGRVHAQGQCASRSRPFAGLERRFPTCGKLRADVRQPTGEGRLSHDRNGITR